MRKLLDAFASSSSFTPDREILVQRIPTEHWGSLTLRTRKQVISSLFGLLARAWLHLAVGQSTSCY
jgi:hypothetical protein